MAQPNGLNPTFQGKVTARGFETPVGGDMVKNVKTNGTTLVNVFGTTNGFDGTLVSVRITPVSNTTTVFSMIGTNGTVFQISGSAGIVVGTLFTATTFTSSGTLQVRSHTAGLQGVVEVAFQATP